MALTISVKKKTIRISGPVARLIGRFRKNDDGATAVEFALISIPFLGLLFAIFETAFVFFVTQGIEAATSDAARYIMTGQVSQNTAITSLADFKSTILCPTSGPKQRVLPSFINCDDIKIDIRKAASWTTADTAKNFLLDTTETFCLGAASEIMVVRILYPMPVYLSILSMKSMSAQDVEVNDSAVTNVSYKGQNRWHMVMGTAVFRNEPFGSVTPSAPVCP